MSKLPIKKARIAAGLTQVQVSKAVGVSQPTYQRWETGTVSVPKNKLDKLAQVLDSTLSQLMGKPDPIDLFGIDKNIPDKFTYFGEVAIHFQSGSKPLLLPISDAIHSYLQAVIGNSDDFIEITSLDNRTVFIRSNAIADIFFSSDAYDDYGPDDYGQQHFGIFPNDDFWKIIEHYECTECLEDEFSDEEIENALMTISATNSDDVIENVMNESDLNRIQQNEVNAENFCNRAQKITWQLSENRIRNVYLCENKELYETFSILPLSEESDYFSFAPEGFHRSIFINLANVDYISVPTHKYREGMIESNAEELGETV